MNKKLIAGCLVLAVTFGVGGYLTKSIIGDTELVKVNTAFNAANTRNATLTDEVIKLKNSLHNMSIDRDAAINELHTATADLVTTSNELLRVKKLLVQSGKDLRYYMEKFKGVDAIAVGYRVDLEKSKNKTSRIQKRLDACMNINASWGHWHDVIKIRFDEKNKHIEKQEIALHSLSESTQAQLRQMTVKYELEKKIIRISAKEDIARNSVALMAILLIIYGISK